ncbi:glycosyltransferase family 2 protein [Paenibacillus arenosi]|uniref:Glycosyltransferase family 2 protein n=1 Tax=Paenibacillus arenosi TaxID=2774142 RepID=A0ABR9AZV6_9BACL|nr:glycosyltransferase family 2 protein [Paenibacillus arenosi]MBD8499542.1 glycosyltransferase family 2 protein [Paenibacillus arenosi]
MNTIISHFYNEEYLLPWWLKHHIPLFEHGILVNRGSTDRSVDICKKLAPHWEVRDSKVAEFDALLVDREMMEIETECKGWKMVLNTTEFLCFRNTKQFFTKLKGLGSSMYHLRTIFLVDDPDYGYTAPNPEVPLVKQRYHGFLLPHAGRFIHRYTHGGYTVGRHSTDQSFTHFPFLDVVDPAFVIKCYFSPWTEEMKLRKLQIGPTMSESSVRSMLGHQHMVSREELEQAYMHYVQQSSDLRLYPAYQQLWK